MVLLRVLLPLLIVAVMLMVPVFVDVVPIIA
jgi:hypothetical protein